MSEYQIIQGDCIERLREMPSESVHCVVTSPPYFGLRDYGTAEWDISNAENAEIAEKCDHKQESPKERDFYQRPGETKENGYAGTSCTSWSTRDVTVRAGNACTKCGAVRVDSQIGLEATPQEFIAAMVTVFEEVRRVLRADGVLFLNLGDSYAGSWGNYGGKNRGHGTQREITTGSTIKDQEKRNGTYLPPTANAEGFKPKDLMLMPHRVAIALQTAGWWVRSDMPWVKRSAMPESVTDRPAKALEYVFMLTKSANYFYDAEAVRVGMAPSSIERLSQDVESQKGSDRVPGKTNGAMKAVGNLPDTWKGSSFSKGKTADHQLGRSQKDRDRSIPTNRNGITEHLDETPAGSRNFRNADLWFSSVKEPHGLVSLGDELVGLDVNPSGFKDAHFATFSPKLVEPLIKAGTSEHGCCGECGAPYERIVEKTVLATGKGRNHIAGGDKTIGVGWEGVRRASLDNETLGWQKTCKCHTDERVPATVLDPFAGAGTTMLVAKRLGRRSIGIELNPEYIKLIERRLEHWHRPSPPKEVKSDGIGPLFDEVPGEEFVPAK